MESWTDPFSARDPTPVGYARNTKTATTAVAFTDRGRHVAYEFLAVFGIHRFRAAQHCLRRNVVLLGKLIHERILSGQVMRYDSRGVRARQLRDRFAGRRHTVA